MSINPQPSIYRGSDGAREMSARLVMVGLGELLWDVFPSAKVLGGAPANFAYFAHVLGDEGIVASRIGADESGREVYRTMQERTMDSRYLQQDSVHPTGTTSVLVGPGGQPEFAIEESVAWDFLEWTPDWRQLSMRADVVCFGSLAQRSRASAETIELFLQHAPAKTLRICDANLRKPFYSLETLRRSFRYADVVKVNEAELIHVSAMLGIRGETAEEYATGLQRRFNLQLVCVTNGARGSLLVSAAAAVRHGGVSVEVADAIGAGDAFTACVAHYYVRGYSLEQISQFANRFAAWVATQMGATPVIPPGQLERILSRGNTEDGGLI